MIVSSDLFLFLCLYDRTKVFAPLKWLVEGCLHAFVELEHGILECARFFQRVPVENMVKIFMFIETSALFVEDLIDAAVEIAELPVDPLLSEHDVPSEILDLGHGFIAVEVLYETLPDLTDVVQNCLDLCVVIGGPET